jgi:hypothetical protein
VVRMRVAIVVVLLAVLSAAVAAAPSAVAKVNQQRVTKGESITLQIAVSGSTTGTPDMSAVKRDFHVVPRGQGEHTQTTIVGGEMKTTRQYVHNYGLTPRRTGTLTIPAITVHVAGETCRTKPISIVVTEGVRLKFSVTFSKNTCYVGEQAVMKLRILSATRIQDPEFDVPILKDSRFQIHYGERSKMSEAEEIVEGKNVMTYTAEVVVIPKGAGRFVLDGMNVVCTTQTGWQMVRGFFGRQIRQKKYGRVTAVAPTVTFTVKDAPEAGRPADFAGIVGRPKVTASASPASVSVGQPIDYAISISGPPYLGGIPPVELGCRGRFTDRFKIQDDGIAGEVKGGVLTFRRTLRALNDKVTEIPALRLSYLDPETGRYEHVAARAIPIRVNPTRVVSVEDGMGRPTSTAKLEIETRVGGIAGNEVGMDVIEDEHFAVLVALKRPGWLAVCLVPLLTWAVLLVKVKAAERRMQDEAGVKMRMAYGKARKAIRSLGRETGAAAMNDRLIRVVYDYVGERLRRNPAGLTPSESRSLLAGAGVPDELASQLERLLNDLEEARFGGTAGGPGREGLLERAGELLKKMEKAL